MRITSQMLNASAQKAGVSVTQSTLLDYLKKDGGDSLMAVLNKNTQKTSDMLKQSNYDKIAKSSSDLIDEANKLMDKGEEGLFKLAKGGGALSDIYESIIDMFESYNSTLSNSKTLTGTLEVFYNNMLKELTNDNSDSLSNVGISVDKDGIVSIDKDKLKSTDVDTLETLFGPDSDFLSKLSFVSKKIADSANANIESITNTYTHGGKISNSLSSKFDTMG